MRLEAMPTRRNFANELMISFNSRKIKGSAFELLKFVNNCIILFWVIV